MLVKQKICANIVVAVRSILLPSYYELFCLSEGVDIRSFQSNEQVRVGGYTFLASGRCQLFEQKGRDRRSCKWKLGSRCRVSRHHLHGLLRTEESRISKGSNLVWQHQL